MAPNYKLSIGVSIDPAAAKTGGATAQAAVAAIGNEAQTTATKLQQLINTSVGLGTGPANQNMREWTGALAAQGKSIDDLRAKYNPLFAVIREYKANLTEIRTLSAQGVLSTDEMTAAVGRQRQAALASIDAIKGRSAALRQGGNDNNAGFRRQNLGYQLTDIAQSGFLGAPVGMIAAQQLPQIAQIYAGSGGLKTAIADVGAIASSAISTVGALPLALGVAGGAALAYFKMTESSAKSVDEVLKQHQENIKALGEAYGIAEQKARSYSEADRAVAQAAASGSLDELVKKQVESARALRLEFGSMQTPGKGGQAFFNLAPDYKPFKEAFDGLDNGIRSGRIEGEKFIETVSQISKINPAYEEFANKILKAAQTFLQLNTEIKHSQDLLTQIGSLPRLDPLGIFSPERDAQRQAERTPSLFQQQQARIAAFRQQANARSPAEQEAAARAAAEAQFSASESSTDRANRIELAGIQALITAEKQLRDAADERARSLDLTVKNKQLELSLIGKTVSETERLRMEQQLISQLEAEAAKNHTTVDPKEIAAIKEKSAAYGALAERIAATNLLRDQEQQFAKTQIETSLVGASDETRRRALAALEAEQQLITRGISLNSSYADSYRKNALAISDSTNALRKQAEAWDKVKSAGEDAIDSAIDRLSEGDFAGALEDVAKDISKTFLELGVKNPLKNGLLGTDYGTMSDIGGISGIFSRLFGKGGTTAGLGSSVGAMSVTAGTVMINGGVGGLGSLISSSFKPNTTLSDFLGLGAANDNTGKAPVISVTRAPLGATTDIASYIAQAAIKRGIDPATALAVARSEGGLSSWNLQSGYFKNGVQEPSFGPYQLYMNGGLGSKFMAQTGLDPRLAANGPAGVDFALDYASKNGWGSWYGAGKAGIGSWQGIGTNSAADAVNKLADSAGAATKGLDTFGGGFGKAVDRMSGAATSATGSIGNLGSGVNAAAQGLGNLGQGFNSFGQQVAQIAAGGGASPGGGLFGSLLGGIGRMFGGIAPTSPFWAPNTTLGSFLINGYADGTDYAPGGIAMVGERGRELVRLPRGSQVIPNHKTENLLAQAANNNGSGLKVELNIINNTGAKVTQRERKTANGTALDVMIDEAVAKKIGTPGSASRSAMQSNFGLRGDLARR